MKTPDKNPTISRSTSLSGLFAHLKAVSVALVVFVALAGCASVKTAADTRDPRELYDKGMNEYLHNRYEGAETNFKALMERFPLSPYALKAELILGDINFANEKYDEAGAYYTNFVAIHPGHARASYALFQKGMSHFKEVLAIDRDQTSTRKALFAFEDLAAAYPDSVYTARAAELTAFLRRRLADREFYVARFYFKGKNYKGALARLRDLLREYPEVGLTDSALYYIGESYRKLGEERLSKDAFTTLVSDYPQSPFVADARKRL